MRFGKWRGVALTFALAASFTIGQSRSVHAGGLHTIPREVEAIDINTGGPYFAPPIPYGHYAKDGLGGLAAAGGLLHGGLLHGGLGHGAGCGLLHGGLGHGAGCGLGHGGGCSDGGCGDNGCGGGSAGGCHGLGLFKKGHGGKFFSGNDCGGLVSTGGTVVAPSSQAPLVSAQSAYPSTQCGDSGCKLKLRHFHRRGHGCDQCSGNGCGICQGGVGGLSTGDLCGSCHGGGCGACGGRGLFGKGGCGACGGKGCGACLGGHGLLQATHGALGLPKALVAKALHKGDIKWFVGPGGPVPLTPGYVPYIVTTRSPRDFFAFPPFNENVP
ncbi:hypothetical protein [Singulisphaera acidiphila]|uniref:Uncharacterized protein n=1 Tax=Singulisphaera acidiphila (strain ATCC BAA-1392 / DSM 18658 / VKM B-2454 / MOB10) TaxID=886293 RepID=L0D8B3_SINAD|nr:hypothetical protein [Singulisphaera acidiphila]AGA25110.1 hypothetical protein Sinac_0698 [Singulisphaera acidiphila DSM 18658]